KQWECLTQEALWRPRAQHQMVSMNGYLWLTGGQGKFNNRDMKRDVWRSREGAEWEYVPRAPDGYRYARRGAFALVAHGDELHLMGGMDYYGYTYIPELTHYVTPPRK